MWHSVIAACHVVWEMPELDKEIVNWKSYNECLSLIRNQIKKYFNYYT